MVRRLLSNSVIVVIAIMAMSTSAFAASENLAIQKKQIVLISSDDSALYQEFIHAFRDHLHKLRGNQSPTVAVHFMDGTYSPDNNAALIITVGSRASAAVIRSQSEKNSSAILATLIPQTAFTLLTDNPELQLALSRGQLSAIYLDQPFYRQLNLIKLLLPNTTSVGSILGPVSKQQREQLIIAAQENGLELNTSLLESDKPDPLPALQTLLSPPESSDVILALPDGAVYNRFTIRPLLLATFRKNVPVFAYSEALVRAGAVAGIYSRPAQLGRQAAEIVHAFMQQTEEKRALPAPVYPAYFQVSVNTQVSELLGLNPPAAAALELRLEAMENDRQGGTE